MKPYGTREVEITVCGYSCKARFTFLPPDLTNGNRETIEQIVLYHNWNIDLADKAFKLGLDISRLILNARERWR
jgi:hypothetical protein